MRSAFLPLTFLLLATNALADSTEYTDLPLRTLNRAKPNFLMLLDNGGLSNRTYSPDSFSTSLRALSGINDGSNPSKIASYYFTNIGNLQGLGTLLSNAQSLGDDDWHYHANDCTATTNVDGTQTVNCPAGKTPFNRLFYIPTLSYSTPDAVDSANGTLPLPEAVASDPCAYTWYVTGVRLADGSDTSTSSPAHCVGQIGNTQPSSSPLYGCTLRNPSISTNTSWRFDNTTLSNSAATAGLPIASSDGRSINRYTTCAWRDGYNPTRGTVNLLEKTSTATYPFETSMMPPENLPKMLVDSHGDLTTSSSGDPSEVVRPDGVVSTLATFASRSPSETCSDANPDNQGILMFCAPGLAPTVGANGSGTSCSNTISGSATAYNGIYNPINNDYSWPTSLSGNWNAWLQSGCSSRNTSGNLYGPFPIGGTTSGQIPTTFFSPYYCNLASVPRITSGITYGPPIIPCANLNPSSSTIWANPGVADYFDTNGNRYPMVDWYCNGYVKSNGHANCGTEKGNGSRAVYTIMWNLSTIRNYATWYSFYRARLLTVKTALGKAINNSGLNSNFRIGLGTIVNGAGNVTPALGASTTAANNFFSAVADFDATHKKEWYGRMQRAQAPSAIQGDYTSALHAAYLWFTGTYPDPSLPTGINPDTGVAYLTQANANTSTTGAASQYCYRTDEYGNLVIGTGGACTTGRTGPLMYSCQANILAFISAGYGGSQIPFIPSLDATCTDPWNPSGTNTVVNNAPVCDFDAGAVALPSYLSATNPYSATRPGPGFFYDKQACKGSDTSTCTGDNISTTAASWPAPYLAPSGTHYVLSSTKSENSIAQLALYYWAHDLNEEFNRQNGANPITAPIVPVDYPNIDATTGTPKGGSKQGVPSFGNDSAFWPHVTTYMVNLGTQGQYDYTDSTDSNPITHAGTTDHLNWPVPTFSASATYQTYLDDMAHAATAGHGRFLSAYDASSLNTAFSNMFQEILALAGSQSAVAVANTQVSQTGVSYAFQSSYNTSGWWGDLVASPIQPTTGIISSYAYDSATCQQPAGVTNSGWSTRCLLRETLCPTYLSGGTCTHPGSNQATARRIVTDYWDGRASIGTPFTSSGLGAAATTYFGASSTNTIAWLRGDSTNENCATGATTGYRCRYSNGSTVGYWNPMGDVVDSEAIVVGPPLTSFSDTGYSTFKLNQGSRHPVVFQGANDGMLHAFLVDNTAGTPGAENWAYIPSFVLPNLNSLAGASYTHQYFVNATPAFGDVDFNNLGATTGAADWRTLLVGGLGKGGRGYYALDVTTPTATSEADAASKVLWTFPNPASACPDASGAGTHSPTADIGYTYGRPTLVKVKSGAGIRWVALVTSGYDNGSSTSGDGNGHLYMLDARTGACLKDIATTISGTPAGTSAAPSGLAYIAASVADPVSDLLTNAAYAGDLLGNVWKFAPSVSGGDYSTWTATKFAALKDTSGNAQAVSAEPNVALINNTPVIYVGTGRYLGTNDVPSSNNFKSVPSYVGGSFYALVDSGSYNYTSNARTAISGADANFVINGDCTDAYGNPTGSCQFGSSYCTVQSALTRCFSPTLQSTLSTASTLHPWVFDLPAGERAITTPAIVLGALMFTSNQPLSDPCQPGGKSFFYMLDYRTGASVSGSGFVSQTILDPTTGDNVMASRPTIIQLPDGRVVGLVSTSVGATLQIQNVLSQAARRVSWKEVPNQ